MAGGIGERRRLIGLLVLAGVLVTGCDFSALPYFLAGGGEPKREADGMELKPYGKEKKAKVVILAYSRLDTRPEFVTADRELSGLLSRVLQDACKENRQKVEVVSPAKIQDFKNSHPDWQAMKLETVGQRFHADYVIYLDIEALSLYEKGSANQLYRGRADIAVALVDVHRPGEDPIEKHFSCEYPSARGPISVDDKNPREFYLGFLNFVAQRLSWYFTAHPFSDEVCN